jgi:hypothetical protein
MPGAADDGRPRTIGDVFYESRVLRGRRWSLRRFATEALDGRIEPVMLSYIEKGERFPSEDLVRQLAAFRRDEPQPLLAILWRDRIRHAIARELGRAFQSEPSVGEVTDGTLAVRLSRAVAALPDDGAWVPSTRWRKEFRREGKRRRRSAADEAALDASVEETLRRHDLIEVRGARVRRKGRHLQAEGADERRAVALQYAGLFAKGLIDRVALRDVDTGTFLRNHYLHVPPQPLTARRARAHSRVPHRPRRRAARAHRTLRGDAVARHRVHERPDHGHTRMKVGGRSS